MTTIQFWNGNKSEARKAFEPDLLAACLHATEAEYGVASLRINNTDYPDAEDESNIFEAGADIIVTVAGNEKFKHKKKIMIPRDLTRGLLGCRLIIVNEASLGDFTRIESADDLARLSIGIPETWVDAGIFRQNGCRVVEKGTFDELFTLLKSGSFDYTALGANEIETTFEQRIATLGTVCIEPTAMIYYPFPLVFYVNPDRSGLARRVENGLMAIMTSGEYDAIFARHHGDIVQRLGLKKRKVFTLNNPFLPHEMQAFRPTLLD